MTRAHAAPVAEAPDLESAAAVVRASGLRLSAARRLVLEALEEIGLVRHVHLGHGPGLYVRAAAGLSEYLLCDRCGAVRAVDPHALDGVREQIRRAFGHEARFTHFPIAGLCEECARAHP